MKQLIILLLLIIAFIIGFSKYNQYKRYNAPKVNYKTDKKLDLEYHNQELVLNYNKAVEDLNSFVIMQYTANSIDVRTPKNDDEQTKLAIAKYSDKLATIRYYESKLEKSAFLKKNGLSNQEIKFLEEQGLELKHYKKNQEVNKIKQMFNADRKIVYGDKSPLIYEVQKKLVANGIDVTVDGLYKIQTLKGIQLFEKNNNLYPDGFLDILTLDALFK
ncbi:peptidoglycan-binding domain-containing protein [uncultured Polaribacter sp.]|uniref:peptidoglycan-binding domain-containing protein n=1 Tax=uncultured Polaribacter sp. TaxID=174711 RepID=UPI00261F67E5|nr:peptidoglycan-binding domain-containing protein [uncultured Polaribacter sp.]